MRPGDVVIYVGADDPCHLHPEGEVVTSVRGHFATVRWSLIHQSELMVIGDKEFFIRRASVLSDHVFYCNVMRTYYSDLRKEEVIQSAEGTLERHINLLNRLFPGWNREQ